MVAVPAKRELTRLRMKMKVRMKALKQWFSVMVVASAGVAALGHAQAPAARFIGTINSVDGSTIVVKTDNGELHRFSLSASSVLKRVEPGQKDLSSADAIQATDLAVGDRALVKLDPDTLTSDAPQALQLVAIKQSDMARKQQQEREAWSRNGASGLVKSVDPAAGTITVSVGAGPTAKMVTVHAAKSSSLRRYAAGSVSYDKAQTAPFDAIHPGDQIHARGQKSADGLSIEAAEIVSGSFRSISATVVSVDSATSSIEVKDLAAKKQITIHTAAESQLRRLPDAMAQTLAAKLKGNAAPGGNGNGNGAVHAAPVAGAPGAGAPPAGAPPAGAPRTDGNGNGNGNGRSNSNDPAQAFNRAPAMQLGDLKKGEPIMLVATETPDGLTAVSLFAGVEALLQAPASQDLLSNWSMGSGGGEGGQ